ncbi:VMAP-C domain-containing protein [Virgisporangium aurantiacum]|uniref:VMAP-C domain-containing protein n=1 Tax=Virgisporangium aurantiacum TaxID=175570 RepID=UPI001950DB71|nr:trypsin-like peptidase domain-containing protein [Virgisporangium aurantiacum]
MNDDQWPAQVFDADGLSGSGSGFLIGPDRVMTAAHVVDGMARPTVRLPARPGLGEVPATVEFAGPWQRDGDGHGDVAVLRLAAAVDVTPARFAARNALDLPRDLIVMGFPATPDGLARIATVRATTARFLVEGEWIQVHSRAAHGPSVAKGYSGAAVALASSGEVVGMITAAVGADRLGHMLPVTRLAHHWQPLADLLPLGPLTAAAHAELRRDLAAVPVDRARTAAVRVVDEDGGPDPDAGALAAAGTAYEVAAYLAEGLYLDGVSVARIAAVLASFRQALRADAADDAAPPVEEPVTVSVQVARSGSGQRNVLLGVRVRHGGRALAEVCHEVVARSRLRARVQEVLPEAIGGHVPRGAQVAVEFILPRGSLSMPVDTWTLGVGSVVQVGWRHPVTVRDLARAQQRVPDWEHDRRWTVLRTAGTTDEIVHWIGCGDTVDASRLAAMFALHASRAMLALDTPPEPAATHPALRAAFDSGIPAILWRRSPCPPECPGSSVPADCPGRRFRARMAGRIGAGDWMDLPETVRRLRSEAGVTDDDDHDGHAVTLLWDPPGQRPAAPPLRMAGTGRGAA